MRLFFIFISICRINAFLRFLPQQRLQTFSRSSVEEDNIEIARNNPIAYEVTPAIKLGHKRTDLLLSIWEKVAFPDPTAEEILFRLSDYGLDKFTVRSLLDHFQNCKDCSSDKAFLMATQDDDGHDVLSLSSVNFPLVQGDSDGETFGEEDYSDLLEEYKDDESKSTPKDIFPMEKDDNIVMRDSRQWVQSVIAGLGVCPFTVDPDRAGIPIGGVRYRVSRAVSPEEAFFRYWEELKLLQTVSEKEISTVLLIFPEIGLFGNYELFESYCESLQDSLSCSTMGLEDEFQLVFFHPKYQFRDGHARLGDEMGAANFARRGPWPMINILRTNQVRAAQKGVPTGQVYKQNEERLAAVGTRALEEMLYDRKWDSLPWLNPKAQKPLKDASDISINWKTVSPLHFSSSPKAGSDLISTSGVCPFSKSEQEAILTTKTTEEILSAKEKYIEEMTTSKRPIGGPKNVIDKLNKKKEEGDVTEIDYVNFADEILKFMEEEESSKSEAHRLSAPATKSNFNTGKSIDVDW